MRFWNLVVRLNKWPILLDILALSLGVAILCSTRIQILFISIPIGLASVVILIMSVKVHAGTRHKLRAWRQLVARNRRSFKAESFAVYMGAPCGRDLIRAVLLEIGETNRYGDLKETFYTGFWGKYDSPSLIIIPYPDQGAKNRD